VTLLSLCKVLISLNIFPKKTNVHLSKNYSLFFLSWLPTLRAKWKKPLNGCANWIKLTISPQKIIPLTILLKIFLRKDIYVMPVMGMVVVLQGNLNRLLEGEHSIRFLGR